MHVREWGICNRHYEDAFGLTRSGLFLSTRPFRENTVTFRNPWQPNPDIPAGQWLDFKLNLSLVIEFFKFLSRFAESFEVGEEVVYEVAAGPLAYRTHEIARFGATSEDVARGLVDGTFGMAEETGRGMNQAFTIGMKSGWGMGEALARALADLPLSNGELSVLLAAHRIGIPCTVHAALGAEIIHQHPATNGAAIGDTSHRDFRRLAASLPALHEGGVVLNLGSAVIMPEVFLKALTIARNLNDGKPTGFTTCDLDMQRHYRPRVNVVQRPTQGSGKGYEITGHHEIMVPMLTWGVIEALDSA